MANRRAKAFLRASIEKANSSRKLAEDGTTLLVRAVEADPGSLGGENPEVEATFNDYEDAQLKLRDAAVRMANLLEAEPENGE
ncbi:hypothetical protein AALF16_26285 [Bacillus cereus]|uniref:hypothetical protein n=1 Tax=Bacillus cereus TaxID=1396 RepID=UPI0035701E3E